MPLQMGTCYKVRLADTCIELGHETDGSLN